MYQFSVAGNVNPMVGFVSIAADNAGNLHANHFKRFKLLMRECVRLLANAGL